jgi:SAM-dependent methyltransferase
VAPERDFTSDLAEEIRTAVAEVAPSAAPGSESPGLEDEAFRRSLARASEHITPVIPPAVRLAGTKKLALRSLRFLWRSQAAFNALALEALGSLGDLVDALHRRLAAERTEREREVSQTAQEAARDHAELRGRVESGFAEARRRGAIQDGRLAALESVRAAPAGTLPGPAVASALPPGLYQLFEERFRGTPEQVAEKQHVYLPLLRDLPGPVLDVGCGRGELLRLLAENGIPASGVEINPAAAAACRSEGLRVEAGEGLAFLAATPDASLGAVVALQVVEHWSVEAVFAFLREARRSLAPGGVLLAETINSDSLSALRAFLLDPSHVRPFPPDLLLFLAESAGLVDVGIQYLAPLPAADRLEESSPNDARLNRLLFGPQDYALIARAPHSTHD